jgi:hypothetical protein
MWLCAGAEKMAKVIGASQQSTGYTAGTKQELKSGAAGGDHRARMDFHCFSVGDAPRGRRWRPCVTRASAGRRGPSCPPTRVESESGIGGICLLDEAAADFAA